MKTVQVGSVYKHYKGNMYYVLALAKHSETLEDLVVYMSMYKSDTSQVWVRPLTMFLEEVIIDGKSIPRFSVVT